MTRQGERDLQHVEAVHRHPGGGVRLQQPARHRQHRRAVHRADVVEAQEPSLKDVVALCVLAIDPPGEVDQQLVEDALEKLVVTSAVDAEDGQRAPGMHRRVDVAERPLIGGQLAVGMHVPLTAEKDELLLGEGQIPGGVPGVLPGVGHGDDVAVVEVPPLPIANLGPLRGRRRLPRVAGQPSLDIEVIELLAPEQPREGLPHHRRLVVACVRRGECAVVGVGLRAAPSHQPVVAGGDVPRLLGESQADRCAAAAGDHQPVVQCPLGAGPRRVDGAGTGQQVIIDAVLGIGRRRRHAPQPLGVGVVVADERHPVAVAA